jgi:hypothetical protein
VISGRMLPGFKVAANVAKEAALRRAMATA